MPDNTYRDVDLDVVNSLIADKTPWSVIEQVVGASRATILKRMDEMGLDYTRRHAGRPSLLSDEMKAKALQWSREGVQDAEIAARLLVSPSTIGPYLNALDPDRHTDIARVKCGQITVQEVLELAAADIPIADIANVAGVGASTIYHHLRKHKPKAGATE